MGYDKIANYYMNMDLSGLKKELYQYLPKNEANNLITALDLNVFSNFFQSFMDANNFNFKEDKLQTFLDNNTSKIRETFIKLFENKNDCKISDSNLGRIIFGSNYFVDNKLYGEDPIYGIQYYDNHQVELFIKYRFYDKSYIIDIDDLENFNIDNAIEETKKEALEEEHQRKLEEEQIAAQIKADMEREREERERMQKSDLENSDSENSTER